MTLFAATALYNAFSMGGNLSLVTLTFDLDIQTRPRGFKHVFRVNLAQIRSAFPEILIHKQKANNKVTDSAKTEPYAVH